MTVTVTVTAIYNDSNWEDIRNRSDARSFYYLRTGGNHYLVLNGNKETVRNLIGAHLRGEITHQQLCDSLDTIYAEIVGNRERRLWIEDIFLYHLIAWITTIPGEAYDRAELDRVMSCLNGEAHMFFNSFIRVSPDVLTDRERSILQIARSISERVSAEKAEAVRLSPEDQLALDEACSLYRNQRMEFTTFATVPEWLAYQLSYLIRLSQMKKAEPVLTAYGMTAAELFRKIDRYAHMLSGQEVIYAVTDGTCFSAI